MTIFIRTQRFFMKTENCLQMIEGAKFDFGRIGVFLSLFWLVGIRVLHLLFICFLYNNRNNTPLRPRSATKYETRVILTRLNSTPMFQLVTLLWKSATLPSHKSLRPHPIKRSGRLAQLASTTVWTKELRRQIDTARSLRRIKHFEIQNSSFCRFNLGTTFHCGITRGVL